MTVPRISAVIVAWNSGSTLSACVDTLRRSAQNAGEPIEIVVVDNASTDEAVAAAPLSAEDVVVRNPINAGYAVAAAQGMARSRAPWVLLLNPDVVVGDGFVGAALRAADASSDRVATIVPELLFAERRDLVNCRGLTVDTVGIPAEIDAGVPVAEASGPSLPPLGGSSGCCLIRRAALEKLGGSEPVFFAYLEDVDLALRLSCAGYTAAYVPDAVAFHVGSASTGTRSPLKAFLVARSRRLLFALHGPHTPSAALWRTIVDGAHGVYTSLSTPFAPWAGRADAMRSRRYVAFLKRSRRRNGPCISDFERPPRASLRNTLSRKRRVSDAH